MKPSDPIQVMLDHWQRERPELDASGFGPVGRMLLLGKLLEKRLATVLAPLDLSYWAFDVLATLRRQGAPFRLTPTALSRATFLTPGAMTNRIDRLESAGLVERTAEPSDRRGVRVSLTPAGLELIDRAIEVRFDEARDAVAGLTAKERATLDKLLTKLVATLGD